MEMGVVFREFVTVALREALAVSDMLFRERTIPSLDTKGEVVSKLDVIPNPPMDRDGRHEDSGSG